MIPVLDGEQVAQITQRFINPYDVPFGYFPMSLVGDDAELMIRVIDMGIDARLEGFHKSRFGWHKEVMGMTKLRCMIHPDEMQILLRRMLELLDEEDDLRDSEAQDLPNRIVEIHYDVEVLP